MKIKRITLGLILNVLVISACSRSQDPYLAKPVVYREKAAIPNIQGPSIDAGSIPEGAGQLVTLSNGSLLFIQKRSGVPYFRVEGTFAKDAFTRLLSNVAVKPQEEQKAIVQDEINKIFSQVQSIRGLGLRAHPEVGYFAFELPYQPDLMAPLKRLQFSHSLLMSPSVYEPSELKSIMALNPADEGLQPRSESKLSNRGFSGLDRIHVMEFLKQAELDIGGGVKVNGSLVNVGVTDTGVTLNHPAFLTEDGLFTRIAYMRDFTAEGRVYFNKSAKFEVVAPIGGSPEDLVINAQVLVTPKLPYTPAGDGLVEVKDFIIKVSPQLRAILTHPGSGAKLGFVSEEVFQSDDTQVDVNGNASLKDKIFFILIPGATSADDVVYADMSGTGDFRQSQPLGDWNKTRATISVHAEKIGFDFRDELLPSKKGDAQIAVKSVSFVGFDPGSHGTHVSGVIAGRLTIANDESTTLARGVAPAAQLKVNRACSNNGGCAATEAMIDLAGRAGVDVINMSLGGLSRFNDGYGVQETIINRLSSFFDVLFIVSAGNSGPGRQTVGSPSTARLALSVGATANREMIQRQYQWPGAGTSGSSADEDFMLFFSSRGPTASGGFKPNLTAPGTQLSSVQLNSAPGVRGGLDVYWGTSMAAPAATGGYALLLDAIRKYNLKNPSRPLPTQASTLREVLIQTARPFDVSRFDPVTGEKLQGQYTWVDQGSGMIDLLAAWKKLFEVRDQALPTAVNFNGKPVELDYQVVTSMKAPNGTSYDGSLVKAPGNPAFGNGVYLNYFDTDTIHPVSLIRRLPEVLSVNPAAGELTRQLKTTRDEFTLKTIMYGSDRTWLKAGTLDQTNCLDSSVAPVSLVGEGATIGVSATDGAGTLVPFASSALNICLDRQMIKDLKPGDHGALITAYRVVNSKVAPSPSFIVPVYLTVPHRRMENSIAYEIQGEVSSFGLKKHYVLIPPGTSLVKVTLEVPQIVESLLNSSKGTQTCSGVELMALSGTNVNKAFKNRKDARISNCDSSGRWVTDRSLLSLSYTQNDPTPGVWDISVFGSYKYARSQFKLRVDYVTSVASVQQIKGDLSALTGDMRLAIKESTFDLSPDLSKSAFELRGLESQTKTAIHQGDQVLIANPMGAIRSYSNDVKKVSITTGGSPGNDIDLFLYECPKEALSPDDPSCTQTEKSDGPTDDEIISFEPKIGKVYFAKAQGVDVKGEASFTSRETLFFESEKGVLSLNGSHGMFDVSYLMTPEQLASSKLVNHDGFQSGKYDIVGVLSLKTLDGLLLNLTPINVSQKK
jgi:subtilisin family serine protease